MEEEEIVLGQWNRIRCYADRYLAVACLLSTLNVVMALTEDPGVGVRFLVIALFSLAVAYDKIFVAGASMLILFSRSLFALVVYPHLMFAITAGVSGIVLVFLALRCEKYYQGRNMSEIWFWYTKENKSTQILLDIIVIVLVFLAIRFVRFYPDIPPWDF